MSVVIELDESYIASYKNWLMAKGEACDPMDADNIIESFTQMDEPNKKMLSHYVLGASESTQDTLDVSENYAHLWLADFIVAHNAKYWSDMADHLAKRAWESRQC